jgi:hypothetical protein
MIIRYCPHDLSLMGGQDLMVKVPVSIAQIYTLFFSV